MENIDLTKILKDCPKDTKLYCTIFGDVKLIDVCNDADTEYPIRVFVVNNDGTRDRQSFTREGCFYKNYENTECILFPSKDNRNWSTFEAPIEKFNIDELKPFDKVLVRDADNNDWKCGFFSHYKANATEFNFRCVGSIFKQCIPYNEETKHLVGTYEMPPKKYINW